MSKDISLVIPAYNEERGLGVTLERLKAVAAGLPGQAEIVVVDDGSSDDTSGVAQRAGVRAIRHPHNLGYGASLKTGILGSTHDTIVILDADGTYPVEAIPELLEIYGRGFDMVVGARTGDIYRGSKVKWPMRIILRFLVEWTTGRHIPDINSGLRIFSRDKIAGFLPALSNSFSFTTSVTLVYMLAGQFVAYHPISYDARIGTSHVRLWRDSLRTLQYIVRTISLFNPIKLFVLLALICGLGGVAGGLILGLFGAGRLGFFLFVLSCLTSVIVFCLGLVVEALRRNDLVPERALVRAREVENAPQQ